MENESQTFATARSNFQGYAPPTSSTTYTPNQFFDVVLPNASRGCVRLVAYLIRQTLGWSDANGNPQNPEATISYRQLEANAGIGRGRVKDAIDEAIEKRFVDCLRSGKPHRTGDAGYSALYSLKWGRQDRYVADPKEFDGFFSGNGNLTHIPNQFFDFTIPQETLAVVKVVGVIIRNTIGFQTKYGFRRQEATLSFSDIMRKAAIGSRTTLSSAIKSSIEGKHIRIVSPGVFDTNAGLESRAAVYGVNWSDAFPVTGTERQTSDRRRGKFSKDKKATTPELDRGIASKVGPEITSVSEPISPPDQDRKEPRNWTAKKTTLLNNSSKQQQSGQCVEGRQELGVLEQLIVQGIEAKTAKRLVSQFPVERIQRQLAWIGLRQAKHSRTGLLIRAIEHDMARPEQAEDDYTDGKEFAAHYYAEIGGNKNQPVSQPSQEESRIATEFLARSDPGAKCDQLGRGFARHVLVRSQVGRFMPRSLVLALRLHSDSFVALRTKAVRNSGSHVTDPRIKRIEEGYHSFVRSESSRLFENADLRSSFESDVASRLEACRRLSERGFEMLRRDLESEDGRRELFREFIVRHHPSLFPSFAKWRGSMSGIDEQAA